MASSSELLQGQGASTTFEKDVSIKVDDEGIGAASISPSGRDVVLASKSGLLILDLDSPYSPPRHILHRTNWDVADVQWSPFACRAGRIATTANQKALIFNLDLSSTATKAPIEFTLHAHDRAITDINFSAHHPDVLATCAVDSFVLTWDLRAPQQFSSRLGWKPIYSVADFEAGATQVKWNRQNEHVVASCHDKYLRIWDTRKGAVPLTTITAHGTKIYGIDWHRTNAAKILTCSLDKTIKLWDKVGVEEEVTQPSSVIRTSHPVWRARHTPFPNGILAMPQRGSSALSLYTHTSGSTEDNPTIATPAHKFQAHEEDARVQEFLWRSRGSFDDGIDNREFQLVSWGTDRHLHLYTVTPELLAKSVGFRKGEPVIEQPNKTRKGAKYVTYRDGPPKTLSKPRPGPSVHQGAPQGALSSLFQSQQHTTSMSSSLMMTNGMQRETMTAGTIRHSAFGRVVSNITWMDGVKVGERSVDKGVKDSNAPAGPNEQYRWTIRDDLAAEVAHVGKTYSKVAFERVEIPDRSITVSFQGPWGDIDTSHDRRTDRKLAFLRLTVTFPEAYPHLSEGDDKSEFAKTSNPLQIEFHKTTASIEEEILAKLKEDMNHIASHRSDAGRDALDAIICYGLGERGLEDSLLLPGEPGEGHDSPSPDELPEEESSSDDDDEGMSSIGQELLSSSLSNANIPLPILCTSRFFLSGAFVMVRIPSNDRSHSSLTGMVRLPRLPAQALTRSEIFESFGRLNIPRAHGYDSESPTSSTGSWDWASSPSSDSGSDNESGGPQTRFQPPMAWQNPPHRFQSKTSHPSSIGVPKVTKAKSVISILASAVDEFVPSKRCLAERYQIFGEGPVVCAHNAKVARSFGFDDLADIWELCKLILCDEVPLDVLSQQHRREQVLVLARRALVRIKRKDSGLDLQFDEADTVTNPKLTGRVKWGHHPVVTWLIPALFDHFEKLADTQMLAMLSCIFSEPAAREGATSAMARLRHPNLPMSMEAPAFSLDYFSSADAAWSLFKPTISAPSTPAYSRFATPVTDGWHRLTKLDTYGSHGSSNGPWGSDTMPSEPATPYSTGSTPPNHLSRSSTLRSTTSRTHTPFSTSPETSSQTLKKSSTGNFASAFATLSRPFSNAISASPPVKSRNEADLSTSAPTSGVTWGATTFYNSGSTEREKVSITTPRTTKNNKRASFGQADQVNIDYYSDTDSDYEDTLFPYEALADTGPPTPGSGVGGEDGGIIRTVLKNQDQFDDEACVSAPLLDMSKDWLYHAWRQQYAEMLRSWGLISQRAEVFKFNGMTSYFPLDGPREDSKPASVLRLSLKTDTPTRPTLSRQSTGLAPPTPSAIFRRSPLSSPRLFSFNPEAPDFQPGTSFDGQGDNNVFAAPPDIYVGAEQYLQLSIPTPIPREDESQNIMFENASLEPPSKTGRGGRPALSRTISKASTNIAGKKEKVEAEVYTCGICWLRVNGRFLWCPSCEHVAHFACMNPDLFDQGLGVHGWDEGECVVGCNCGCGFNEKSELEEEDIGSYFAARRGSESRRRSAILEAQESLFRKWEERGGWLPEVDEEREMNGPHGFEAAYGHSLGTVGLRSPERERKKSEAGEKRKGVRRSVSAK